jgi:porin
MKLPHSNLPIILLASGLLCMSQAMAEELADTSAWSFGVLYMGETLHKIGNDSSSAYLDNLDLILDVDGGAAFGIEGLQLFAYALYNNGHVWAQWQAGGSSVRAGLYDLNAEFDAIDTAALFLNPSHGIGPDYAQSGLNGPSIFPNAGLAVRIAVEHGPWSARAAVLEAVPGDPDHPEHTTVRWDEDEGFLYALEVNRALGEEARMGLGYWRYSKRFETFDSERAGSEGIYALVESPPWSMPSRGELRAFARVGRASPEVNPIEYYVGGGLVWSSFITGRPDDQIGIAVAHARVGDEWRDAQDSRTRVHETVWELTARFVISDRFAVQPDLQYVVGPGASDASAVWIAGLRFELGFTIER